MTRIKPWQKQTSLYYLSRSTTGNGSCLSWPDIRSVDVLIKTHQLRYRPNRCIGLQWTMLDRQQTRKFCALKAEGVQHWQTEIIHRHLRIFYRFAKFNMQGCFLNLSRTPPSSTLTSVDTVNQIDIVVPPHQEFRVRSSSNAWRHRVARSTNACITLTDTFFMRVWQTRFPNFIYFFESHSCKVYLKGSASSCHVRVNAFPTSEPLYKNDVASEGSSVAVINGHGHGCCH